MPLPLPNAHIPSVMIVGGGLAGIAAAWALQDAGCRVRLLEARDQLGGRATSYVDKLSGDIIDNCQHVSMGCCTNLSALCKGLGLDDAFTRASQLYFVSPQGTLTTFGADPLPAPFHLTRAFWKLPYLSAREKLLFALGVRALARSSYSALTGVNFENWLRDHSQTENLIRNAWEVVLVSALSETLNRVDAAYARKVFVDGFLANTTGWIVEIPTVSLDELYSRRAVMALRKMGIDVRFQTRVTAIHAEDDWITSASASDEPTFTADDFILAVPHHQVASMLPPHPALHDLAAQAKQIESAPISSVHFWFDRPITELPHAVLVGRVGQWMFSRGKREIAAGTSHLYQVVISASHQHQEQEQASLMESVRRELEEIFPPVRNSRLLHSRIITERRAVFSATPGIDRLRPCQQTGVGNLQVAGDWTQTGWPATMEGAVRSGFLAARNILHRHGVDRGILEPDLEPAWTSRWLFGLQSGE